MDWGTEKPVPYFQWDRNGRTLRTDAEASWWQEIHILERCSGGGGVMKGLQSLPLIV